jgi:hypothetical protein
MQSGAHDGIASGLQGSGEEENEDGENTVHEGIVESRGS